MEPEPDVVQGLDPTPTRLEDPPGLDAAREQWREAYNDSSVRHDAALKREWRKAQDLATEVGLMRKERDNLAAENARLREVVEAAEELPTDVFLGLVADAIAVAKLDRKREFYQAVFDQLQDFDTLADAYRASQNTPARPPESTESQDQAEPAVASTNTAIQAERALVDTAIRGYQAEVGLLPDPEGIYAAIRAAAPALRAGALRDAADAEVESPDGHDNCACFELGVDTTRAMLRERADRIGGAT